MSWEKKGLIYATDGKFDWSISHAQVPILLNLNDRLRIYYSTRNKDNQSCISFIETHKNNPSSLLYKHPVPVLKAGKLGTFDDCGVMPTSVIKNQDEIWLYYIGWNVRNTVPYHNSLGLAISNDGGITFERYAEGPVWGRSLHEPYFTGTSFVKKLPDIWRMWYLSCTEWVMINNKPEAKYLIKHSTSSDGIHWKTPGEIAIGYSSENEAIANASVLISNGKWYMWYSYRKISGYRETGDSTYKIGVATSNDGHNWKRKDLFHTLQKSKVGWDSQMIAYPHVTEVNGELIMLYNGNQFGKTGFGWAKSSIDSLFQLL